MKKIFRNYHNKNLSKKKSLFNYSVHASSSRNGSSFSLVLFVGTSGNGPILSIIRLSSSSAKSCNSFSKSASLYKSDCPIPGPDIAFAISSATKIK